MLYLFYQIGNQIGIDGSNMLYLFYQIGIDGCLVVAKKKKEFGSSCTVRLKKGNNLHSHLTWFKFNKSNCYS